MTIGAGQNVDVADLLVEHNSDGSHKRVSNIDRGLESALPASPVTGDVYASTDTKKVFLCFTAGTWETIQTDKLASVSLNDTTPGYLNGKLVAGQSIVLTEQNDGSNETLKIIGEPPPGAMMDYGGRTAPSGWLLCYGQAVSRATYSALYAVLCPSLGTFTVTIASPGVLTITAHGLSAGDRIRLFTTGALPTGLTANTDYYVKNPAANTFELSATYNGSSINTSGSQNGTHTAQFFGHGAGDGSTTFNVPDRRGRVAVGKDDMGGSAAGKITATNADNIGRNDAGAETHTLVTGEMPAHAHNQRKSVNTGSTYERVASIDSSGEASLTQLNGPVTTSSVGSDTAHNNVQPYLTENVIIKT